MITFKRIDIATSAFEGKNHIGEANIFQTSTWINFVAEIHKADPVVAAVMSDGNLLGYFTGLITHKFGLKILGSPFRGWLTYFMGFNLLPDSPQKEILQALPKFAFEDLGCHYLELIDPNLAPSDWEGLSYKVEHLHYYGIDISKSEKELFNSMDSTGRNRIRQSLKKKVVIEEATDTGFADEYYAQYKDVLAKHSLTPTFSLNSVRKLIEYLLPTGNLLLLRARNPEGICIATGIFLVHNKTAVVWGTASWREYQALRPNEPIAWYGMKNSKARGVQMLHYGGKCEQFKEKLGARELELYRLMKTKNKYLSFVLFPLMSPKNDEYRNWFLKRLSR